MPPEVVGSPGPLGGTTDAASRPAAVLFDVGGVITTSPFTAFARYEAERGLPTGLLRRVNATDPDTNAWAALERAEIDRDAFALRWAAEAAALAPGAPPVDGGAVLDLLGGDVRPVMVSVLRRLRGGGLRIGLLTNNVAGLTLAEGARARPALAEVLGLCDVVVESSVEGVRKPEPAAYRLACERLGVAPERVVYLDDLGINLKPARALGMITIKVGMAESEVPAAVQALGQAVGLSLTET